MTQWVYIVSEDDLWTVGFYRPDGTWEPESDHKTRAAAAERVHWLNGGSPERTTTRSLFRKKPVVVEAVFWNGQNYEEVAAFLNKPGWSSFTRGGALNIETLEGTMTAQPGDWIIKGVKGEFYPCNSDVFAVTYEPVDSSMALLERP